MASASLLTQYFYTEVQPKLFAINDFLSRAVNDDGYVNYDQVNLPHAGSIPLATIDRAVLPASVSSRTDVATSYSLEEITTDPTRLGHSEELVINYNKRQSILDQHASSIMTTCGDRALWRWAAGASGARVIKSTGVTDGGTAQTRTATGPSQSGTRNRFGKDDLVKIRQMFFADNVIKGNVDLSGVAILTAQQYGDLIGLPNVAEAQKYGRATFPSGVVDRVLGFDIYVRSNVLVYDNSDVLKIQPTANGYLAAATDQDAALFFHPSMVRRAVGAIIPFVRLNDPLYYGDIMDMLVRFGAAPVRNDNKGIVVMMEDNG
jgi:hypothetical protein